MGPHARGMFQGLPMKEFHKVLVVQPQSARSSAEKSSASVARWSDFPSESIVSCASSCRGRYGPRCNLLPNKVVSVLNACTEQSPSSASPLTFSCATHCTRNLVLVNKLYSSAHAKLHLATPLPTASHLQASQLCKAILEEIPHPTASPAGLTPLKLRTAAPASDAAAENSGPTLRHRPAEKDPHGHMSFTAERSCLNKDAQLKARTTSASLGGHGKAHEVFVGATLLDRTVQKQIAPYLGVFADYEKSTQGDAATAPLTFLRT